MTTVKDKTDSDSDDVHSRRPVSSAVQNSEADDSNNNDKADGGGADKAGDEDRVTVIQSLGKRLSLLFS